MEPVAGTGKNLWVVVGSCWELEPEQPARGVLGCSEMGMYPILVCSDVQLARSRDISAESGACKQT